MDLKRPAVPILILSALVMARAASAQQTDQTDPLDNALVRLGPVGINPSVSMHDVGRDENVFNDPVNPKSDVTFTLSPRAEVLFRPRIVHIDFLTATDYVYYRTYASQRGTDETATLRADFDLPRVQPFVSLQGINSRNRYNQEVDERARHHQTSYSAGAAFTVATRTSLTLALRRTDLSFDQGATFRGTDLAASFDSRLQGADLSMAVALTPFTTASVVFTEDRQRFTFAHDRDANTLRISPTVTFSPQAIVKGSVSVGYSRFTPQSPLVPGWSGVTSTVNLTTALLGRYQIEGLLSRGIQYSYDLATPYYVTTGGTATFTMALFGPVDVKATGTRQRMAYRTEQTAETAAGTAGSDTFTSYGGGVGYRIRNRVRLGVNADWSHRASQLAFDRTYRNRRVYASMTWGVQQ